MRCTCLPGADGCRPNDKVTPHFPKGPKAEASTIKEYCLHVDCCASAEEKWQPTEKDRGRLGHGWVCATRMQLESCFSTGWEEVLDHHAANRLKTFGTCRMGLRSIDSKLLLDSR
ncbi:uncharacterized protein LOC144037533 isoform X2 [Vanacampus margaritifer]